VTAVAALMFRSLQVVVGHRTCIYGYDGCDQIHGHPRWADVVAVGLVLAGLTIAAWALASWQRSRRVARNDLPNSSHRRLSA